MMSLPLRHWPLLLTLPGFCGYTHAAFITDKIEIAVYAQASQQGAKLGTIGTGTQVEVLSSDGDYAQVRSGNKLTGWVPAKYLSDERTSLAELKQLQRKVLELETELLVSRDRLFNIQQQKPDATKFADLQRQVKDAAGMRAELEKTRARVKQLEAMLQNNALLSTDPTEVLQQLLEQNTALEQRLGAVFLVNGHQAMETITTPASAAANSATDTGLQASLKKLLANSGLRLTPAWFIGSIIAAIIVGIFIGFAWLDKRIRRRHGGFRLY